jgi:hypothetical protein
MTNASSLFNQVSLAGTPDYLTISDWTITRNLIDLTTDVTGDLPVAEGGTGSSTVSGARTNLGVQQIQSGTWTPYIDPLGSGPITYTTQTGNYTKIGTRVLWNLKLNISSWGSFTGFVSLQTSSLPFAISGSYLGGGLMTKGTMTAGANKTAFTAYIETGSGAFRITTWKDDGTGNDLITASSWPTSSEIHMSGWYIASS